MQQAVPWYLSKRADLDRWPLQADSTDAIDTVIVIPCLAERESLPATLASLATNPTRILKRTLVVCVVNNREPAHADPADIQDNQSLLRDFQALLDSRDSPRFNRADTAHLRLAFIDASSPGCELPPKNGVGLARKIGMDWAVSLLERSPSSVRVICALDADTTVANNYLSEVRIAFKHASSWAGVVHFEHPLPDDLAHRQAIIDYECFLRCHVHGLRQAESPYAFHTVGSTMACTPEAYVAVSGMNRKQAGEDFYFLQQLAKTGRVQAIATTTVYPSARVSRRVPFGTGMSMRNAVNSETVERAIYAPDSYRVLRDGLTLKRMAEATPNEVLAKAEECDEHLAEFLRAQDIDSAWSRVFDGAQTDVQRRRKFHTWFDAFRAIKLLHYLRDNGRPDVSVSEAARTWMPRRPDAATNPEIFLQRLREQDREAGGTIWGLDFEA